MMGHQSRLEALFYYFRLEDQVPENHLLRLIDRQVNFEFIRAKLKDAYSDAGRPWIDPELLLRMLLVGYLYGVTSERKLVEELRMHLAWRWFTGVGFDQEIPHHSVSKRKSWTSGMICCSLRAFFKGATSSSLVSRMRNRVNLDVVPPHSVITSCQRISKALRKLWSASPISTAASSVGNARGSKSSDSQPMCFASCSTLIR